VKTVMKSGTVKILNMCPKGHKIVIERDITGPFNARTAIQNAFNAATECSVCKQMENEKILALMNFQ